MSELRGVLAVDPGKLTGFALWTPNQFVAGEKPHADFLDFVWQMIDDDRVPIDAIVCESFTITADTLKKSRQYDALEQIGALRWMSSMTDAQFVLQTPAAAKSFSTNERLKTMGWYQVGRGHANDAIRHLILFLAQCRAIDLGVIYLGNG